MLDSCEVFHNLRESGCMITQVQFREGMGNVYRPWHLPAPSYVRLVCSMEKGLRMHIPQESWIHKALEVIYL